MPGPSGLIKLDSYVCAEHRVAWNEAERVVDAALDLDRGGARS